MSDSDSIPLSSLGLSKQQVASIENRYPDLEAMFAGGEYKIPTKLIVGGIGNQKINSRYLLQMYKQYEIRPERLFEYGASVFSLADQTTDAQTQKRLIAEADASISESDIDQVYNELQRLEEYIDDETFFRFLASNYARKSHELEKRLKYEETPNINDVWEINLLNAQGQEFEEHTVDEVLVTVVVEAFVLPEEVANKGFSDSPAVVSIVGEYEEHKGIEEGGLLVATPNAFREGTFIENLGDK